MQKRAYDVSIEALRLDAIIGILDFERKTPQPVEIDIVFTYEKHDDFIDYAKVAQMVKTMMRENKYLLIEDALDAISTNLRKIFPSIISLDLKITKPSILPDCRVSVASHS